jgi:hypothetical protein
MKKRKRRERLKCLLLPKLDDLQLGARCLNLLYLNAQEPAFTTMPVSKRQFSMTTKTRRLHVSKSAAGPGEGCKTVPSIVRSNRTVVERD